MSWLEHNSVPDRISEDLQVLNFESPLLPNCKFQPINKDNTNFGSGNPDMNNLIAVITYTNEKWIEIFHDTCIAIPTNMNFVASVLWCHLVIFLLELGTQPFKTTSAMRCISQKARKSSIFHSPFVQIQDLSMSTSRFNYQFKRNFRSMEPNFFS